MEETLKFICSSCGCCCRRVGNAIENMKNLGFPYEAKEDGSCQMLDENNRCKVYENRPDVCNVEKMFDKYQNELKLTPMFKNKKEFYEVESKICNKFIQEDKLDEKYLIDLKQYD